MLILIRLLYYRAYRRSELFLTFFSFNLVIFLIAFVLTSAEISMGAAFGLFAVFSMLRYRTEGISATDMTYLFLGVAIGLIMAIGGLEIGWLAAIGVAILGSTALLEGGWLASRDIGQEIMYDRVELVAPDRREALLDDLRERTGLAIHRVEVREIDFVRDLAKLTVFHAAEPRVRRTSRAVGTDEVAPLSVVPAS
jgi:hypothetical protein